jgi:hypothetical protein
MPQHLWSGFSIARACEVCFAHQVKCRGEWSPQISPICPGDPDDAPRRVTRRRPLAPAGGTSLRQRELEPA